MKIAELVKEIASKEGKTQEVSVGNIREIVGIVSDILAKENGEIGRADTIDSLIKNGKRRAKKS